MGGLLIFGSVIFSSILWAAELNIYVITALSIYLVLTVVGFFDDYLKISEKTARDCLEGTNCSDNYLQLH